MTFTNSGANDTFAVGGTNLGTVNTTANYVTGTVTCSGSTMGASGATVTVTLGTCLGLDEERPEHRGQLPVDAERHRHRLAGNPMSTAIVTGSNGTF